MTAQIFGYSHPIEPKAKAEAVLNEQDEAVIILYLLLAKAGHASARSRVWTTQKPHMDTAEPAPEHA